MKAKFGHSGISLTEMTVVVAIVAVLAGFGLPAIRGLVNSFETEGGTRAMISSALASARAIAAKEQRYAGIRFQHRYDPQNPDFLKTSQYMIFIVHEEPKKIGNIGNGFRAVQGQEPIKLPTTIGVMDLLLSTDAPLIEPNLDDSDPANRDQEGRNIYLTDATSFSVLFSPSGRLVIHDVRVRNKDGDFQPLNPGDSEDDIFNSPQNINQFNRGMFVQDDYSELGLGAESSRNNFVVYDREKFRQMTSEERFDYLFSLDPIYINAYTGTIINR